MTGENRGVEDVTEQRRVVITGASSGIGLAAAVELARTGDEVVLVGRDPTRLTAVRDRIQRVTGRAPELFRADFAVLDDVRRLAANLRDAYDRIDVLANNAGGIAVEPITTVDGFEWNMQANHLAPFLLTNLLSDRVRRVVNTASDAHRAGALDPDDLSGQLRHYRSFRAYGTSKQANILFTAEAARRWPHIRSYAFHPGVVRTRFGSDSRWLAVGMRLAFFLRSPEKGARTLVWLARQDPATLVDGGYYLDLRPRRPHPAAADPERAARLWTASEQAVGL